MKIVVIGDIVVPCDLLVEAAKSLDADAEVEEASLDSYIRFIRRRLAAVGSRAAIVTVRGAGYRLELSPPAREAPDA